MLHPHGRSRAPGTRGGRSGYRIRRGSLSSKCRARPPPVAERAQPPAMLRAPWPRGLNLAAAPDPAGPGCDGECGARGLGQGRAGDFQKPSLEMNSWGVQPGAGLPGRSACLLRAGGVPRGTADTLGLVFLTGGVGASVGLPLQTGLLVTDSVKALQKK